MPKYRKKPVVIEAIHFTGRNEVAMNVWVGKWHKRYEEVLLYKDDEVYVNTLEGLMLISKNDYLIRGIQGEFYPCKPDIFEASYEIVKNDKD